MERECSASEHFVAAQPFYRNANKLIAAKIRWHHFDVLQAVTAASQPMGQVP